MKRYLTKYWKINALVLLVMVFGYFVGIIHNFLMIGMTQELMDGDLTGFIVMLLSTGVLILIKMAQGYVCTVLKSSAIRKMNNQVRKDMGNILLKKNHGQFHEKESGQYLSWFTNDVNQIENTGWNTFYDLVGTFFNIGFAIIALSFIHWSLVLLAVLLSVVIMFFPKLFTGKIEKSAKSCSQAQEKGVAGLKDLLSGYDVLKFFGKEERFENGVETQSDSIESSRYHLEKTKSLWGNVMNLANVVGQMSVLGLVGYLAVTGKISAAVISGGGNLCSIVYNGIIRIANLRLSLAASKPYFEKIKIDETEDKELKKLLPVHKSIEVEALNFHYVANLRLSLAASKPYFEKIKIDETEDKELKKLLPVHKSIEVEALNFHYDKKPILKDSNLSFEIGKKYAITGSSGCGKSTLLKILLGWLPEYSGKVLLDGNDAREYTTEQLQEQMGYIEQNVFLFNTSIRENITLGENFTEEQLQKALHDSALIQDLQSMPDGLNTVVGEEGRNLSGGQKQRVAIARALIHNRSILLVDEGTSALDKKNADIVEDSLLSNPELTLILVSHHLSEERKAQFDKVYELKPVAKQ